jgi:lysophospholipase L1-like esterase
VARYTRYVAIGDSQTEGLWDGDESVGLMGFADRLAAMLDSHYPGLTYANLAVRGRRIRDVLDDQLPQALAMRPDLITVCIGMNDVTRPGRNFDRALADLDDLHAQLARSGATVATTTFPDLAQILPVGRLLLSRVTRINEAIRTAADRHGFRLVDLYSAPSMTEPDTWSADRVHGSTKGHTLFAAAAAEALGLPGSNHDWAKASDGAVPPSWRSRAYSQALWTENMFVPWIWRHVRARSSGDGRGPKRPRLESVRLEAEYRQRNRRRAASDG